MLILQSRPRETNRESVARLSGRVDEITRLPLDSALW
jgi:hypothetical protein